MGVRITDTSTRLSMSRSAVVLLLLVIFSAIPSAFAISGSPDSVLVPLANPGFEVTGENSLPKSWSLEDKRPAAPNLAGLDIQTRRGGNSSFQIIHATPGSTVLRSSALHLQVGKLYRLSAWIRTDHAIA